MSPDRYYVRVRGALTDDVRAALDTAGIQLTGLSHSVATGGGVPQESHSMYVEAESAEEAVERARSALADVAVYVDESAKRLGDD